MTAGTADAIPEPAPKSAPADDPPGSIPDAISEEGATSPPGSLVSEAPEGTQEAAELADLLRPSGRASSVVGSVRARTSFVGTTNIQSVVITGDGHPYRVPLSDLVALHSDRPFVEPVGFAALCEALTSGRVVVCHGQDGCGKEAAVTRACLAVDIKSVQLLPAGLGLAEMCRVIETAAADSERVSCVLPALDDETVRRLAGPQGAAIRALTSNRRVTVVATTATDPGSDARRSLAVVHLDYPDRIAVLDAFVSDRKVTSKVRELAGQALALLTPPVSPAVIAALVDDSASKPDSPPVEIAQSFVAAISNDALGTWIGEGRTPIDVAVLAVGASLSGTPAIVVREHAEALASLLHPGEDSGGQPRLLGAGSSWPTGFLHTRVGQVQTHFGTQSLEIIEVIEPHRPQDVVQAMWKTLGTGFQRCYCDWLRTLPGVRALLWHAAYTAGVLFAVDPVLVEAQVLRPWALSQNPVERRCAGSALGAPVAMAADPAASRALAKAWATSDRTSMQQAAIAAYAGLLGAWDPASAAPLQLFRLGERSPGLRREADWGLASLVVAGPEASGSRGLVLAYLNLLVSDRVDRSRVFGCLPSIVERLVSRHPVCLESLTALRAEPETWAVLHRLMGISLVTPAGVTSGRKCLALFVKAAAQGHVDHEVPEEVLIGMRTAQRGSGTVARLGTITRRTLAALARSDDDDVKGVVNALMQRFFG